MEKKGTIISLTIVVIIVASAAAYIVFSGMIAHEYNYVQIEINPRVEFLCDKKFDVISVFPLNDDARVVLSDLDLIGLDVDDAATVFIDECAKTGFIDVNGVDNSTNITVIDGITQALDVHVTRKVYQYYKENEIMSAVIETYEDRSMFDQKKENKINCSNKYKLITTILETDNDKDMETLRKNSEVELVEIVADRHEKQPFIPTEEEIQIKQKLISENKTKYNKHKQAITNNTQKEFSNLFEDYQKNSIKAYQQNFNKEYALWQEQRIS